MDGPARVSVMYLYMILHTYINLDPLGRRGERPQLRKSRCACERATTLARGRTRARVPVVREFVGTRDWNVTQADNRAMTGHVVAE